MEVYQKMAESFNSCKKMSQLLDEVVTKRNKTTT